MILKYRRSILLFGSLIFIAAVASAQTGKFVNDLDQELNIKNFTVLPLVDNLSGIYAQPITQQVEDLVERRHQWNLVKFSGQTKFPSPEELEDNPTKVLELLKRLKVDSFIAGRISRGPNGLSVRLSLFTGAKGLPLVTEQLNEYNGFELADVKNQTENLFKRLLARIPYTGIILSRRGQVITVNMGSSLGIREGQDITAVQIIKLTRHPKFHFVTAVDRVVIARLKITKVEDSLSFAALLSEREENALVAGTKVLAGDFKEYSEPSIGEANLPLPHITDRSDQEVAFGNSPKEWIPESAPTLGKVGILLGLGNYQVSNSLSVGGVSDSNQIVPSVHLLGEMWLSPEWFLEASLRQYVFRLNNNYPGTSLPSKLNVSTQQVTFLFGYNFLIAEEFFGPKLQVLGGYTRMNSFIDQSNPAAFNSVSYTGFAMGVSGSFPVNLDARSSPLSLGGRLLYYLNTNLDESPTTSGASNSSKITQFSAFTDYRYTQRIILHGELNFDLFGSTFTGAGTRTQPASSVSHTITTLAAGIEYLF